MSKRDPRPWKKGDKFSASHMNEPVDAVMPLTRLQVHGANLFQTRKGTVFTPGNDNDYDGVFWAILTNTGPAYQPADFPDERYWAKYAQPKDTTLESDSLMFEIIPPQQDSTGANLDPYPFCVSNIPETPLHTHNLAIDETRVVTVYAFTNRDSTVIHYFMEEYDFPVGQYQYMIYQNVTQNQMGMDFFRGHALLT